jgi:Ca2+-transporting ATPase
VDKLVTDGLPGLALASESEELNIMKRPPKDPKQNIFTKRMAFHVLWVGFLMGILLVHKHGQLNIVYHIGKQLCSQPSVSAKWTYNGNSFPTEFRFKMGLLSNKPLLLTILITVSLQLVIIYTPFFNVVFKTQPLTFELTMTVLASSIVFCAVEIEKMDDSAK